MRHCHCGHGCGEGGGLLLLIILPIILFVWFMKLMIQGFAYLCAAGVGAVKTIHNSRTSKQNDSIIPTEKEIDEYEMYDNIFDD